MTESNTPIAISTDDTFSITQDPHMLLGQIRHFATRCRTMLEDGIDVDLHGMDDQVQILCAKVKEMPSEEALKMRPKMDSLIQELDDLAEALETQKARIKAQLNDLVRQQKAHVAYQKVESSAPREEE